MIKATEQNKDGDAVPAREPNNNGNESNAATNEQPDAGVQKLSGEGIDPVSGERKSVTLAGLQKETTAKKGVELYDRIARVYQFGAVRQGESSPALDVSSLNAEQRAEIDRMIAEA